MAIASRFTVIAAALALLAFQAQAVDVTIAYQTSAEPAKVAQADKTFEKLSGAKPDWRKFDSAGFRRRANWQYRFQPAGGGRQSAGAD